METLWAKVAPAHTWCFPDIFLDAIASLESSLDKSVFQPVKEREIYLFQVFYRVSKSDLWSYMGGGGQDRKRTFSLQIFPHVDQIFGHDKAHKVPHVKIKQS